MWKVKVKSGNQLRNNAITTVPILMWHCGGIRSSECRLVFSLPVWSLQSKHNLFRYTDIGSHWNDNTLTVTGSPFYILRIYRSAYSPQNRGLLICYRRNRSITYNSQCVPDSSAGNKLPYCITVAYEAGLQMLYVSHITYCLIPYSRSMSSGSIRWQDKWLA